VANVLGFWISCAATESHQKAHLDTALGVVEGTGEAVQDPSEAGGAPVLFKHIEAVGPCIAAMDDDGQFGLCSGRQRVAEYFGLYVARRVVVVIVEADLAPGNHFRMLGKASEFIEMRRRHFLRFVGMDANAGVNPVVLLGVRNRRVELLRTGTGAN